MHCHERREANVATTFYDSTTGYYVRKIKTLTGRYRKIKSAVTPDAAWLVAGTGPSRKPGS